jgi:hypothetical protein
VLIAPPISQAARRPLNRYNENYECNHQQQMNQTSGYVKTDSQSQNIRGTAITPKLIALSLSPKKYAGTILALHQWIPSDLTRNRSDRQSDGMCS